MSKAQQEPRIKTEPVDNDIYIVEAPTVPTVAKLAHGVANRTDVSALEEVKNRAIRIAELPKRLQKTLKVVELDVMVRGTVDWIESKARNNDENAVYLREFLRDFKNLLIGEVVYGFLKDILEKIEAKIVQLERAQIFISKDNIKCLIAEFLLPQCELRTKQL